MVVVAAIEHAEEAAVGGQVQGAGADFALEAGRRQVVGLQLTQAAIALMGEHHHLAAQFQGQVGETPVGAEDQMARAAAGRGRDECRIGRLQRTFGLFRGVAVDEYLVGAEVGANRYWPSGEDTTECT